jgi:3',5'-cyclic AMP phosphodiesterase CpdA
MYQSFAQISDPHLSTLEGVRATQLVSKRALGYLSWRRKRRFEHRREILDALQRDLRLHELDQLLVTGDLTHVGLPSEFEQARTWLRQLGNPQDIALVPGNHDACVAAPWEQTFALWQEYMASDQDTGESPEDASFPSLRIRGDIAFIGLSTACPKPPLMATGTAGPDQLSRLPDLLRETREQGLFRVVYLHHCPVPGEEKWRKRLTDAEQLSSLLEQHGAELVLHGHGHRGHFSEICMERGILPVVAIPSASAMGLHGADVAQYNRYRVQRTGIGWGLRVDARVYDREAGQFVEGEAWTMEMDRR